MNDLPYNAFGQYLKKRFNGIKTWKIPINAGFSCPNKDGSVSSSGCIFCDEYSSGPLSHFNESIETQIENYIMKYPKRQFIAYYQANSNTHAPVSELRAKYEIIFNYEKIVGLYLGTRPDALADDVYPLLEEINKKTYLTVELGLQSVHEKSLRFLKRNHTYSEFENSLRQLKQRNIDSIVHLIIGIPGESIEDMIASVVEMNRLKPTGIKFHLFHVLKDTELERLYKRNEIDLMEMDEYIAAVSTLLCYLDPEIVIHRLTGERDRELFVSPEWALNKAKTLDGIVTYMKKNQLYQGKYLT